MIFVLFLLLILSLFLEGTKTIVPLVVVCFVCMVTIMRSSFIFFLAFLSGIILDVFALRTIGGASIFLLIFVFLMLLYRRKYEIYSYPFVFISSFAGSLLFLLLFGYQNSLVLAILSSMIAFLLFVMLRYAGQIATQE